MSCPLDMTSSAIAASTNGVMSWYWVICVIGVIRSCTRPITIAATNVTLIERSWAISAAASEEISDGEGERGVVERGQVGEQDSGDAREQPAAKPRGGLDPADRDAERRR